MTAFVAYDVTRLLFRYAVQTPNGIDRIDIAYARHFLGAPSATRAGAFMYGFQPALIESSRVMPVLATIDKNWREGSENSAPTYQDVEQFLLAGPESRGPLASPDEKLKTRAGRFAPILMLSPSALKRILFQRFPSG